MLILKTINYSFQLFKYKLCIQQCTNTNHAQTLFMLHLFGTDEGLFLHHSRQCLFFNCKRLPRVQAKFERKNATQTCNVISHHHCLLYFLENQLFPTIPYQWDHRNKNYNQWHFLKCFILKGPF